MLALLPDIHANRQALDAVLADALLHGSTRWAALGDLIGFGGDPVACVQLLHQRRATALRGNHEEALHQSELFSSFPEVQRMTERTRALLPTDMFTWLTTLPHRAELAGLALTHANFHAPERWWRLRGRADATLSFAAQPAQLALFAHTHRPTLFCMDTEGHVEQLPIRYDEGGSFTLRPEAAKRYLVNPGSVGQPRDGDPRAAYALWDATHRVLTLRRVHYDVDAAATRVLRMGLPGSFAKALQQGLSPL